MPDETITSLLERTIERVEDRTTRMIVSGNLRRTLALVAECIRDAEKIRDRHHRNHDCALVMCDDCRTRSEADALLVKLGKPDNGSDTDA